MKPDLTPTLLGVSLLGLGVLLWGAFIAWSEYDFAFHIVQWLPLVATLALLDGVLLLQAPQTGVRFAVASFAVLAAAPALFGVAAVVSGMGETGGTKVLLLVMGVVFLVVAVVLGSAAFAIERVLPSNSEHRLRDVALFAVTVAALIGTWTGTLLPHRLRCAMGKQAGCHKLGEELARRGEFDATARVFEVRCTVGDLKACEDWRTVLDKAPDGRGRWSKFDAFARDHCSDPSRAWMCLEAGRHAGQQGHLDELERLLDIASRGQWGWRMGAAAADIAASFRRFDLSERYLESACPEGADGSTNDDCWHAGDTAWKYPELGALVEPLWKRACTPSRRNEICCRLGRREEEAGRLEEALDHYRMHCPHYPRSDNIGERACCNGIERIERAEP